MKRSVDPPPVQDRVLARLIAAMAADLPEPFQRTGLDAIGFQVFAATRKPDLLQRIWLGAPLSVPVRIDCGDQGEGIGIVTIHREDLWPKAVKRRSC